VRALFRLLLAVAGILAGIGHAETLRPVATGYVTSFGRTFEATGITPPYENYPIPTGTSGSYQAFPAGETLTLFGNAGVNRYSPPYYTEYDWSKQFGWAAFQIPQLDHTKSVSAEFTATYTNSYGVTITDLSPASFNSPATLFNDVTSNPYAQVPGGTFSPRTVTTLLGGTVGDDIFARQGDIFYIGLMGPCCSYEQPTVILSNMALTISSVPLPASAWLFLSGILGIFGWKARRAA
jgi:hypothetical protein